MPSWEKTKALLIHPNSLTMYRIAAVPVIVILLFFPNRFCLFLAALLFSAVLLLKIVQTHTFLKLYCLFRHVKIPRSLSGLFTFYLLPVTLSEFQG